MAITLECNFESPGSIPGVTAFWDFHQICFAKLSELSRSLIFLNFPELFILFTNVFFEERHLSLIWVARGRTGVARVARPSTSTRVGLSMVIEGEDGILVLPPVISFEVPPLSY